MNLFLKITTTILLISFAVQGIAEEDAVTPVPATISEEQPPLPPTLNPPPASIRIKNAFLFGSLSPAPGGGVTIRRMHNAKGRALDFKIGVVDVPIFDTTGKIPTISVDYNFLYFAKTQPFYLSWGAGFAYFLPYIPLRAGVQFKYGFIDIGGKLLLGFLPIPEVRAGAGLNF
jgi:hypothetical protein